MKLNRNGEFDLGWLRQLIEEEEASGPEPRTPPEASVAPFQQSRRSHHGNRRRSIRTTQEITELCRRTRYLLLRAECRRPLCNARTIGVGNGGMGARARDAVKRMPLYVLERMSPNVDRRARHGEGSEGRRLGAAGGLGEGA